MAFITVIAIIMVVLLYVVSQREDFIQFMDRTNDQ